MHFVPWTRDLLVSRKTMQRQFLSTLHPLSLVIFTTATLRQQWWHLYCFAILGSASVVIHSVKQHLLRNQPRSDAATSCDFLHERFQRAFTYANQLHWTAQYWEDIFQHCSVLTRQVIRDDVLFSCPLVNVSSVVPTLLFLVDNNVYYI